MENFTVEKSSANIEEVIYSDKTNTLYIVFNNKIKKDKRIYQYDDFTKEEFDKFKNSESKGKFFHSNINKIYTGILMHKF